MKEKAGARLAFAAGEITEWPLLARLLKDGRLEKVVHCAAVLGVPASVGLPIGTFRVNIEGAINLLEAIRLFGVRWMVNISSKVIYGPFLADVIDENHRALPTRPYGISKFVVEQVCRDYSAAHGLECVHTRTCWIFGPFFPRSRAPRILLDAAISGRSLHLPGGANYAVDQVHVNDVIQGALLALDKERLAYDAYHVTTDKAVSISEVVGHIKSHIPSADISMGSGPLRFVDGTEAVRKGALSIAHAERELEFRPN